MDLQTDQNGQFIRTPHSDDNIQRHTMTGSIPLVDILHSTLYTCQHPAALSMSQDIPHDSSPSALLGETVAPAQPGAVPVASTPTPTQVPVAVSVPERAAAPAGHEHAPQPAVTAAPSHAAPAPSSTTAPAHIPERTTAPPVASEPAPAPAPTANATHQQPTAPVERLQIINEKQEFTYVELQALLTLVPSSPIT